MSNVALLNSPPLPAYFKKEETLNIYYTLWEREEKRENLMSFLASTPSLCLVIAVTLIWYILLRSYSPSENLNMQLVKGNFDVDIIKKSVDFFFWPRAYQQRESLLMYRLIVSEFSAGDFLQNFSYLWLII